MRLDQMLDITFVQEMIAQGYVRRQFHPSEPLAILNYTEKAAYESAWNDVTLASRGLVYNIDTLEIIARPFPKFFNYEQLGPEWLTAHLDDRVGVTDKMDGSLGILYRLPSTGQNAIATRGSFTSDQALHATEVLRSRYADFQPAEGITYLFEIIYPENRIVLDYYGMDDLVLLGAVSDNGISWGPEIHTLHDWAGPRTHSFGVMTLREALAMKPRQNSEGIVAKNFISGDMVKIKQADYVALHRLVTGLTERTVWEAMVAGKMCHEIQEPLPEEFWPWVEDVYFRIYREVYRVIRSVGEEFSRIVAGLPGGWTRKDFALAVRDSPNRAYLFKCLDNQPIQDIVLSSLKPEAIRPGPVEEEE